jgi:hypothetical protein
VSEHPDYVIAAEIAREIGVCTATIRKLQRAGRIPALRVGTGPRASYRYNLDEVTAALRAENVDEPAHAQHDPEVVGE